LSSKILWTFSAINFLLSYKLFFFSQQNGKGFSELYIYFSAFFIRDYEPKYEKIMTCSCLLRFKFRHLMEITVNLTVILECHNLVTNPTNQIKNLFLNIHEAINVLEMIAVVLRYSIFNDYKYNIKKPLVYLKRKS
jgi:hypothetical protein